MKNFFKWIGMKEQLDAKEHVPPFVSERDFWWASLGENIGSEINGKSDRFTRPVLILKKLGNNSFLVAPSTTQPHSGDRYIQIMFGNKDQYICLNQVRTIDYRRLFSKLGQLSKDDFKKVKQGFQRLYT